MLNIIDYLNINFVWNKFDILIENIRNFNIFLVSESKLNSSFPVSQFKKKNGYTILRRDGNRFVGGLLFYLMKFSSFK